MPIKLVDLKRDQRTIEIPIGIGDDAEETLTVTYKPSEYSSKTEAELNTILQGDVKSLMGTTFVQRLVLSWDLIGDDGEPYPITLDSLAELPSTFIGDVVGGVAKDMGKARRPN